jgi:hypothetical protein
MENLPNLDCMDREDLFKFWCETFGKERRVSKLLFPDKPSGYVKFTR